MSDLASIRLSDHTPLLEERANFTSEFLYSFAYSAFQSPLTGAAQLCDRVSQDAAARVGINGGTNLAPSLRFMNAPDHAEFGTSNWHAQQLGSAAGLAADILAVTALTRRPASLTGAGQHLTGRTLARQEISRAALTGGVLGGIFTPVDPQEDFWKARSKNALVQGLTFGTLAAATVGLQSLGRVLEKSGRGGAALLRHEITSHVLAGLPAGVIHAQSESILSGKGIASPGATGESVYTFTTVGGVLGAFGAMSRLKNAPSLESTRAAGDSRVSAPPAESVAARPFEAAKPGIIEPAGINRVKTTLSDGTVVVEFPGGGANGTRRILTRTDGTKVYERIDGVTKTVSPDGTKITDFVSNKSDFRRVTERVDGSRTHEFWNGDSITRLRDGTVIRQVSAEGKTVTKKPDGTIITDEPGRIVYDVERLDPVREQLHREVRTVNKRTGEVHTESPGMSRNGDYIMVDGYLGRRRLSHDVSQGSIIHEVVDFSRGPLTRLERRSDGTWCKSYRNGSLKSEGYDWVDGVQVRFLEFQEGTPPSVIESARKHTSNEPVLVMQHQSRASRQPYQPDGRIESVYEPRAWQHEGQTVASDVLYPEGSVGRQYDIASRGRAESELSLSAGIRLIELRRDFTAESPPSFEIKGPDGSTIELRGGRIALNPSDGFVNERTGRTPFEFDGQPQRFDYRGDLMQPFDTYEVRGGATRHLYKDGVTVTIAGNGRTIEIRYLDGLELRLDHSGRWHVQQKNGTTHTAEFTNLLQYRSAGGTTINFD